MNSTVPLPPGTGVVVLEHVPYGSSSTAAHYRLYLGINPSRVPGRRDSEFDRLKRRIGLMVLALIAPELVLFALRQRDTTSRLYKGMYLLITCSDVLYQNTSRSQRLYCSI
jgi:hypothetical protein